MTHLEALPTWAALLTAFLVLLGATLTLLGAIGTLINLQPGQRTTTIESKTNFFAGIPVGDTLGLLGTNFGQAGTPTWVLNLEADPRGSVRFRGTDIGAALAVPVASQGLAVAPARAGRPRHGPGARTPPSPFQAAERRRRRRRPKPPAHRHRRFRYAH